MGAGLSPQECQHLEVRWRREPDKEAEKEQLKRWEENWDRVKLLRASECVESLVPHTLCRREKSSSIDRAWLSFQDTPMPEKDPQPPGLFLAILLPTQGDLSKRFQSYHALLTSPAPPQMLSLCSVGKVNNGSAGPDPR